MLLLMLLLSGCIQKTHAPEGFVYIGQLIPDAQYDIRYYGEDNFIGTRVDGYKAPVAILTYEAAQALKEASTELDSQGYYLKVFDAYRPQKAVDHFIRWSKDSSDIKMKSLYYPHVDKKDLFALGFLAKKSGHSRGSTVDLTLVYKETGEELDMGSSFDYLDQSSAYGTTLISTEQAVNREILKSAMSNHGFRPCTKEWWHFTLIKEPYPNRYFNFDVK
ncbi:MAG: M15 family metallopeptidase [Syntrophomonadaceae bacterium]|nr:M15 family metallopeptidase [Syntrophomonadaceae bacterium]